MLLIKSVQAASSLMKDIESFNDWKPSQWTFHLDEMPAISVYAVWLIAPEKESLKEYLTRWKNIKPFTTGDDLKTHGLEPGPKYKEVLTRLRAAWLDGEVTSKKEETTLLTIVLSEN